jgi:hypothetical protein
MIFAKFHCSTGFEWLLTYGELDRNRKSITGLYRLRKNSVLYQGTTLVVP